VRCAKRGREESQDLPGLSRSSAQVFWKFFGMRIFRSC